MPCTLVCLTPVIIASWPAISGFAASAVAALGYTVASSISRERVETEVLQANQVELEVDSVVEAYTGQEMQFTKEGVELTISTSRSGRVVVRARGQESEQVLRQKAAEFAGKMQQAFAYDKAMTQLRQSKFNVVQEKVDQNGKLHLKLRRW